CGSHFLLAYNGDNAVGYAGWSLDTEDSTVVWLDQIYVLREARRMGIAGALMDHIMAVTDAATFKLRVNRHNDKAITAYARLGFAIETTDVKPIGGGFVMDDYIM